jgi:hypothetical protein
MDASSGAGAGAAGPSSGSMYERAADIRADASQLSHQQLFALDVRRRQDVYERTLVRTGDEIDVYDPAAVAAAARELRPPPSATDARAQAPGASWTYDQTQIERRRRQDAIDAQAAAAMPRGFAFCGVDAVVEQQRVERSPILRLFDMLL